MLNLNASNADKVQKATNILAEVKNLRIDEAIAKQLKKTMKYMSAFHTETNKHFMEWMKIYYQHEEQEMLGEDDDWFDKDDLAMS